MFGGSMNSTPSDMQELDAISFATWSGLYILLNAGEADAVEKKEEVVTQEESSIPQKVSFYRHFWFRLCCDWRLGNNQVNLFTLKQLFI